jgi:glycosyltransferase involved in cell wall biosynthesis
MNPFLFFPIRKLIREKKITHLILEHPYYGWLGLLLKYFCGVKLIIHSHNIENQRFKSFGKPWWRIMWWYEKWISGMSDFCFFISEEDQLYAQKEFGITPVKTAVITYGIDTLQAPSADEKKLAKINLQKRHQIKSDEKILLFNGTLSYGPNLNAIYNILDKINPLLLKKTGFHYKIIICGSGLPTALNDLKDYQQQHIIFAGFVNDIREYFLGADLFINPVTDGGGIKTKLVESIACNLDVVSTENGAFGVRKSISDGLLCIVPDTDWEKFTDEIVNKSKANANLSGFFDFFNWAQITRKAATLLKEL